MHKYDIHVYKPRPASWVKFLPPAQAKEIIVASVISAVSATNFRFNCWAGFLPCQLPFLHVLTFLIFTHSQQHGQICSRSKSKYALKTTKINYAVWLEIYAVWFGIYAVSVCHFLGRGFQDGHMSSAFFMWRKSPPHLWN